MKAQTIEESLEQLQILVNSGDVTSLDHEQLNQFLLLAAQAGNKVAISFLLDKGANIEALDAKNNTPLLVAAGNGKIEAAKLLINYGADVNVIGSLGLTVLHLAIMSGRAELAEFVIDHGAQVNKATVNGDTALIFLVKMTLPGIKAKCEEALGMSRSLMLNATSALDDLDVKVAELLISRGANVNILVDKLYPLLYIAILGNNSDLTKLLINQGAYLLFNKETQWTALQSAAACGNLGIVKFLVNGGLDVDHCNDRGQGPLFSAAKGGHIDVFKYLLEQGAELIKLNESHTQEFHNWQKVAEVIRKIFSLEQVENVDILGQVNPDALTEFTKNSMLSYLTKVGVADNYCAQLEACSSFLSPELLGTMITHFNEITDGTNNLLSMIEAGLIAHLEDGISPLPYIKLCKLKEGEITAEVQNALVFYKQHPEFQIPGNYLLRLIECISDVGDISALNHIMLINSTMAISIFDLIKDPLLHCTLKDQLVKVVGNHAIYMQNMELLNLYGVQAEDVADFKDYIDDRESLIMTSGDISDPFGNSADNTCCIQ